MLHVFLIGQHEVEAGKAGRAAAGERVVADIGVVDLVDDVVQLLRGELARATVQDRLGLVENVADGHAFEGSHRTAVGHRREIALVSRAHANVENQRQVVPEQAARGRVVLDGLDRVEGHAADGDRVRRKRGLGEGAALVVLALVEVEARREGLADLALDLLLNGDRSGLLFFLFEVEHEQRGDVLADGDVDRASIRLGLRDGVLTERKLDHQKAIIGHERISVVDRECRLGIVAPAAADVGELVGQRSVAVRILTLQDGEVRVVEALWRRNGAEELADLQQAVLFGDVVGHLDERQLTIHDREGDRAAGPVTLLDAAGGLHEDVVTLGEIDRDRAVLVRGQRTVDEIVVVRKDLALIQHLVSVGVDVDREGHVRAEDAVADVLEDIAMFLFEVECLDLNVRDVEVRGARLRQADQLVHLEEAFARRWRRRERVRERAHHVLVRTDGYVDRRSRDVITLLHGVAGALDRRQVPSGIGLGRADELIDRERA